MLDVKPGSYRKAVRVDGSIEQFVNRLRLLRSLDYHELDGMTETMWARFRDSPYMTLMAMDERNSGIVWRALRKRET